MNERTDKVQGATMATLALRAEMQADSWERLHRRRLSDDFTLEVCRGADSLWVVVRRGDQSGFALRTAYAPGPRLDVTGEDVAPSGNQIAYDLRAATGTFRVTVAGLDAARPLLRCTTHFTPSEDLLCPWMPRDLYPLDANGDPLQTEGIIHAAQRGTNSGLLYVSLTSPEFGSVLYFQNLTALNSYFTTTGTKPDGMVGGDWPELGTDLPTCGEAPLKKDEEITLGDVFLHLSAQLPPTHQDAARLFVDLLAGVYEYLPRPDTEYHPWPRKAEDTRRDLEQSPKASLREHGYRYLYPYTQSENPDSMVQLTVLLPLREYAAWRGEPIPLADELRRGIHNFYDVELNTVRRYLASMPDKEKADEVDSWYLYHPLTNLARLARDGDGEARELLLGSLPYAMRVARTFAYRWPVKFNLRTLEIITNERKPGDPGQSDAGGLYAYVMLHAYELTGDQEYLDEARRAIDATRDFEFDLAYQTNLTAWGAGACLWLWRITGEEFYREQSFVFVASFLHNCALWESRIDNAQYYRTFFGLTALHDGPYLAPYEAFESYAAFYEYLERGGDDLPGSVRRMLTEYCRYTLDVGWYFYPSELPPQALAPDNQVRNNRIDRKLEFPLEDLYVDGQPAGQVGQEVYGSGMAFALTSRAYRKIEGTPLTLFTEFPVSQVEASGQAVRFQTRGVAGQTCRARVLGQAGVLVDKVFADDAPDAPFDVTVTPEGDFELVLPADRWVTLCWAQKRE